GANVLWDAWVHPLVMGLEEHLLGMFRDDFEFNDTAQPSHLGHGSRTEEPEATPATEGGWTAEAEKELKKVPFFVRGKVRRNTEAFAAAEGRGQITLETLYDAKAHYAR
ncbi:MAG: ferredoxin:protochlorophyllide reductase (ATP-dependent) subunit B, partial [Pseudomonadota bacterium]